jgi:aryl-alcohol dehydrogenase-like predicted oxidoreductase
MVKGMLNPRGLKILDALDQVSSQVGATPAQVALAWLMAKPAITAPIASATNLDQFKDLLAATRLQLTERAMAMLDEAGAGG